MDRAHLRLWLVLGDGRSVEFRTGSVAGGSVIGTSATGTRMAVAISDITEVREWRVDPVRKSALIGVGSLAGVWLVTVLLSDFMAVMP